jgi:hypothetical protein
MGINDLNRLLRKQEMEDENNFDDTGLTQQEQDVETQLLAQEQNREIPVMMQGVDYTERPEREPILDRDAMFKSQAAVDEGINAPGVVESGETSQEEFDKLRGNILADAQKPAAEPPKSKEQLILEQLQKMRQDSDEELKSAKSRDRWLSLANSLNNALSRFDQASVLKATRTPGMQAIAPGVLAPTSSAKEVLAERQAKINELMQEQKLMAALQPKTMSKLDEAKIKESEAKARMYESKAKQSTQQPSSVFEKKKMENLATAGVDYITKDRDQLTSNVDKINSALDLMKKAPSGPVSGAARGLAPDVVRSFTNPEAITTKEYMQSAIQETLRPTLGAQFTETEGKKIMELAYNEKADPTTNMKKATALKNMIEKKVEFSDALYKHLEENGTDKGFPYEKYGMRKASGVDQGAQKNTAKVGDKTFQVGQTVTIKGKQYIVKDAKGNLEELK